MTKEQIEELRTEGKIAADKGMRIGHYCLAAADTIERLNKELEAQYDYNLMLDLELERLQSKP